MKRAPGGAGFTMTDPPLEFCQINPTFESLGLVADFLSTHDAFSEFEFGPLTRSLAYQIEHRHHLCAFAGKRLLGYCGWLPVRKEQAERWLQGRATLEPAPSGASDAVALTIVAVKEKELLRPMIRLCRKGYPNTPVFFKRDYAASGRATRKSSVINRQS